MRDQYLQKHQARRSVRALLIAVALLGVGVGGDHAISNEGKGSTDLAQSANPIFRPLPDIGELDTAKVSLGRRLFHEPKLSANGAVACSTCHNLSAGGDDDLQRSLGVTGNETAVNTPTVYNTALHFAWFWDGRAASLEEQIDGPIHHPDEMGSDWESNVDRIKADTTYRADFRKSYRGEISERTIKDAIATFERSLITPNSRFDRHLKGEEEAMTAEEVRGYDLFQSLGCPSCHQGPLLGANLYQRLGIFEDYFVDRGGQRVSDFGRFNVTGVEEDRFYFKVPSLRNVALTAPYFHDGSAASLEEAVAAMAFYQLGRSLDADEIALVAAFLKTLTGVHEELPSELAGR